VCQLSLGLLAGIERSVRVLTAPSVTSCCTTRYMALPLKQLGCTTVPRALLQVVLPLQKQLLAVAFHQKCDQSSIAGRTHVCQQGPPGAAAAGARSPGWC
jgi:hypothetical protein